MTKAFFLSLVAGAVMMVAANGVNAQTDTRDVVKDARGNIIKNTWNNCVRTKWDAGMDTCDVISDELLAVYFGFDSDELTPASMQKLDTLLSSLNSAGNVKSVSIVGFADPIGNSDYNYNLSNRRASAVEGYLRSRGYLQAYAVDVRGMGEDAPVSECGGLNGAELKACLWRDRRVEIRLNY